MTDDSLMLISPDALCEELIALRGEHGRMSVHKFARHPILFGLYGNDLTDGYLALTRELARLAKVPSKYEAAAAWSIIAPADKVIDRLVVAAEKVARGEEPRDQRTIRHWSDRGMLSVAHDLIAFAGMRGTYGQDLVGLSVSGSLDRAELRVVQTVTAGIPQRAPVVTFVGETTADHDSSPAVIDLNSVEPDDVDHDGDTVTRAWTVAIPASRDARGPAHVQVVTRRSPTPVFFVRDTVANATTDFAVHRSMVEIHVHAVSADC